MYYSIYCRNYEKTRSPDVKPHTKKSNYIESRRQESELEARENLARELRSIEFKKRNEEIKDYAVKITNTPLELIDKQTKQQIHNRLGLRPEYRF